MFAWIFGVIGIVGLAVLLWYVRKTWQSWNEENTSAAPSTGFTLGDLRDMRKKGQITEVEYERAKAMIVDNAKRVASNTKTARPTGGLGAIIEAEQLKQTDPRNGTGGFPVTERKRPPTSE